MLSPNAQMALGFMAAGFWIGLIVGSAAGAFLGVMVTLAIV